MLTFSCCFHCNTLLPLPSTHYYWHISQIIITFKGELLLSKCNCILVSSYPLSPPFPFDHNYTCRRVKWGEHGMGPMQHSLTTATPFKSQKILFKARALGSNLIHGRLSTSQLPILDPPSPVIWFTSFLSCPPTPYGLTPSPPPSFARFCDTRICSILPAKLFSWSWALVYQSEQSCHGFDPTDPVVWRLILSTNLRLCFNLSIFFFWKAFSPIIGIK